jgi:PKD domain
VDWGDGTGTDWTTGTTISHVYKSGGTFTPRVTLTDEAGNSSGSLDSSAVVVKVDKTGPSVTVAHAKPKHSVTAWKSLHGKASDAGVGVMTVRVKAVEKRAGHWYGYNARAHRWVRAATKTRAFARSTAFATTTNAHHQWNARLRGLRKGTLVVRAWAIDELENHSSTVTHRASLTRH